ncbi:AAA family ATPase [Actinoplanes sp. NPDC089786]|uniref:AAA family ATPase n=1 Tax=Actinoplanes sp. NPDC089786 TaxID=3155185 RepID=UPI003424E023
MREHRADSRSEGGASTTAGAPTLVVIRGNSGSGKTTTAREVRSRYGRGCALVEQDHLRRIILREHDEPGAVAPAFITATVRSALGLGYHVVLEGILHGARYRAALLDLLATHPGPGHVFYLDISFEETVRRHATRGDRGFTTEDMRDWYVERDLLGVPDEVVLDEGSGLARSVATIMRVSGLDREAARTPCPVTCPRCAEKASLAHGHGDA